MLESKEDLLTFLLGLGDTSDAIADALVADQCKGEMGNAFACPVAQRIKREMPDKERHEVIVGCWATVNAYLPDEDYQGHEQLDDEHSFTADLPNAVAEFTERFDKGDYPALIADGRYVNEVRGWVDSIGD